MKPVLTLKRTYRRDCVTGVLTGKGLTMFTLELPDRKNAIGVSCIPEGTYECVPMVSKKLGACFDIRNVPGRTLIRVHAGNYTSQIQGCILAGTDIKDINGDGILDVTNSRMALQTLLKEFGRDGFTLVIKKA